MKTSLIHLLAIFRLMFLDARALDYLNTDPKFIKKSLFLPVFFTGLHCLIFSKFMTGENAELFTPQVWVAYFFLSTIGWTSFLLLARKITRLIDRPKSFYKYVVAFCWSTPIQSLVLIPSFIFQSQSSDETVFKSLMFSLVVTFVYVLQWGIAKTTLKLNGLSAVGLVVLFDLISDFMPTILVHIYAVSLAAVPVASVS